MYFFKEYEGSYWEGFEVIEFVFKIIDKIAVKYIEWRSDYTRHAMVALYHLALKRHKRRTFYTYEKENYIWKCVDECIFCGGQKELYKDEHKYKVDAFLEENPLIQTSLIDCKGKWR